MVTGKHVREEFSKDLTCHIDTKIRDLKISGFHWRSLWCGVYGARYIVWEAFYFIVFSPVKTRSSVFWLVKK
jgi:hypothetical protein